MDDIEKLTIAETTRKAKLEAVSEWTIKEEETCCENGCVRCGGTTKLLPGPHPAAIRAKHVLDLKTADKEAEVFAKLIRAGRFHASFKVIGTLSSRMSGADGLNAHGIKHTTNVRGIFPLAWNGMVLSIGDFDSFEVTIADAVCKDPDLRADLLNGKKIHGIFGQLMYPEMTYEEVCATKNQADDRYTKGKQGFFATILYGGTWQTLVRKLRVLEVNAKSAIEQLLSKYQAVARWRAGVSQAFCSMTQPGGIGTRVVWREPADYCETFLGFRRYFTLENKICKALFDLARQLPKGWRQCKIKVLRRDRVQTADGAVSSALYGAAFGIQSGNVRAAANHQIQSPGAQITKRAQRRVWELQPTGIHDWLVAPFQVHDEVAVVSTPETMEPVAEAIAETVESFRAHVPLIKIGWHKNAASWAEK
jgi:DNA polymerase I-like protein with 3'-5' exonuclease and polymerase domains